MKIKYLKKQAFVASVLIFYAISSSFTFPVYADDKLADYHASEYREYSGVSEDAAKDDTDDADDKKSDDKESDDKKSPDKKPSDEKSFDEKSSDKKMSDEESVDTKAPEDAEATADKEGKEATEVAEGSETVEVSEVIVPQSQVKSYDDPVEIFDKDDWRLLLINKQHPIPEDYTFETEVIRGSMRCDSRVLADLLLMLEEAKEDDIKLVITSPYRDIERQTYLFNRKVNRYMDKGCSYMEAYRLSSQAVMVPGASEHEVGLAIDITSDDYSSLNEGFAETDAGKWLAEHAHEYGFILRYLKGKEYITSVEFEPWHFRYVGRDAAKVMYDEQITLEEFIDSLENDR